MIFSQSCPSPKDSFFYIPIPTIIKNNHDVFGKTRHLAFNSLPWARVTGLPGLAKSKPLVIPKRTYPQGIRLKPLQRHYQEWAKATFLLIVGIAMRGKLLKNGGHRVYMDFKMRIGQWVTIPNLWQPDLPIQILIFGL